ncbi:MAG: fibronectin type III domain-containing protein [Candidatus Thermoplasmatota archaeon]|nr:fibronectin type III domain-containing protein [Candidatus Thermoplasmatota archaeon]
MRCLAFILVMITMFPGIFDADAVNAAALEVTRSPESIEGNLTIGTGDILVFRNRSVVVEGHMIVHGTLVLINSTLTVEGTYSANDDNNMSILLTGSVILSDRDPDANATLGSSLIKGVGSALTIRGYGNSPHMLIQNSNLELVSMFDMELEANGAELRWCGSNKMILNITDSTLYDSEVHEPDLWSEFSNTTMIGTRFFFDGQGPRFSGVTFRDAQRPLNIASGDLSLTDCVFINNTGTIAFFDGCDISVTECRIEDNRGFFICQDSEDANSSRIVMRGCTVTNSSLNLYHSTSSVSFCAFSDNSSLIRTGLGRVSDCSFLGSSRAIDQAKGTTIVRCRFNDCQVAIDRSSESLIYHNAFLSVGLHFMINHPSNRWNGSSEGNYHRFYNGLDDGSGFRRADDGIGDTNIPFLGVDHYPLMSDHYWSMPAIPSIETEYINGSANVTVIVRGSQSMRTIIQDSTSSDFINDLRTFSISGTFLIVPECVNGTHYFRARTFNEHGSRGWSLPVYRAVDQRPLPPRLEEVTAPKEGGSLIVSWKYVGEDVSKVWIYYNEVNQSSGVSKVVDFPVDSVRIDGLKNGRTYRIQLFTQDRSGLGSLTAAVAFAMPMDVDPPDPPRKLEARSIDNSTIVLSWIPPMAQDISEYRIVRRRSDEEEFSLIATVTRERLSYDDRGLRDNTSYQYGVIAVDDDGPLSEMAGPIDVRTLHVNNPPFLIGGEIFLKGVEDEGPIEIDIRSRFRDVDGDSINIRIAESFPFPSMIDGIFLRVSPEKDQAGEGYVQLSVDDGESVVYYLIWVLIEHRPDPPKIESIVSPANGSTHLPGTPIKLQATIWDPDIPYGDVLEVEWRSNLDGLISYNNASLGQGLAYLSPGKHVITLIVTDSNGSSVSETSRIAVSIWGFGEIPWSTALNDQGTFTTENGFQVLIDIANNGPLLLTFRCTVLVSEPDRNSAYDRVIVLSPNTNGSILIIEVGSDRVPSSPSVMVQVRAETFNGTFAGESNITKDIVRHQDPTGAMDPQRTYLMIGIATVSVMILIFIVVLFFIRKKYMAVPESAPDVR